MTESWTIGRLLTWTSTYLQQHGSESARLDAEVLLAHARNCQRIELYTCFDEVAPDALRAEFRSLVHQRANGMPVAYLVGHREFYSREFAVTPDVLIPRPETEFVLIALLDHIKETSETASELCIADVGTGSGILAICAALELPNARITGIDISEAALTVAGENAERHQMGHRIEWKLSDLFEDVEPDQTYDYIISNPPYIAEIERSEMTKDVLDHEPHQALFAGEKGLDVLVRLVTQGAKRLRPGGCIITEISPPQVDPMKEVAESHGLTLLRAVDDLSKRPRVLVLARD